jgi:hypothetical protein
LDNQLHGIDYITRILDGFLAFRGELVDWESNVKVSQQLVDPFVIRHAVSEKGFDHPAAGV